MKQDEKKYNLFTKPDSITKTSKQILTENIDIYSIQLVENSLFPLNINPSLELIANLENIQTYLNKNENITCQFILSRVAKRKKENLISQYVDYLNGLDNPFFNPALRKIQKKLISVLDSFFPQDSIRYPNEEIERKLVDDLFHMEGRILLFSIQNKEKIINLIELALNQYRYSNSLKLTLLDGKKILNNIMDRSFTLISKNQIISKTEFLSFFPISMEYEKKVIHEIQSHEKIESIKENERMVLEEIDDTLIQLLPEGVVASQNLNQNVHIESFNSAFKNLNLLNQMNNLRMISNEEGATLQKLTFSLPVGIKLSEIKNNQENIQALTGIDYIEINKGSVPNSVSFMFPRETRSIVYLKHILVTDEFYRFMKKAILPFTIGTDEIGMPIYIDLAKVYHLLIAGSTGSGKSVFLVQLLLTLTLIKKPSELQLYMIDPKRVELKKFKNFPHVKELVYEPEEALVILNSLVQEMERRYELLDDYDVDELSEYNKLKSTETIPYIVCVIDEFADLIMLNEDVKSYIVRLGQKARACGIHLICATQRPEAKIVDGLIKTNLPTKISFRCSSINDYKTVFGSGIPFHLLGNGDGSIKLEGAAREFIRFQGPVIHENKSIAQTCLKKIAELIEDDSLDGIELLAKTENPESSTPIDKLKKIIATTGETRISQLQKEIKMRINTVQDLMTQLVDEGWLVKHKANSKGYELVAPEEILSEWREEIKKEK